MTLPDHGPDDGGPVGARGAGDFVETEPIGVGELDHERPGLARAPHVCLLVVLPRESAEPHDYTPGV